MASYNNIVLLGNVGIIRTKTFANGGKVVEASMATSRRWKDRNGEQHEETQWHNLVIGGTLADVAERYVEKGSPLFVTGEMTYREYMAQDGTKRSVPEVRVQTLQLMGKKGEAAPASAPALAPQDNVSEDLPF